MHIGPRGSGTYGKVNPLPKEREMAKYGHKMILLVRFQEHKRPLFKWVIKRSVSQRGKGNS